MSDDAKKRIKRVMQVQCQPGIARIYFLRKTRPQLIRNASRVRVMNRAHRVIMRRSHHSRGATAALPDEWCSCVAFLLKNRFSELAKVMAQPVNASASAVDLLPFSNTARFLTSPCQGRIPEKTFHTEITEFEAFPPAPRESKTELGVGSSRWPFWSS